MSTKAVLVRFALLVALYAACVAFGRAQFYLGLVHRFVYAAF